MNSPGAAALRQAIAKPTDHCHCEWTSTFVDSALYAPHCDERESNRPLHIFVRESWFPVQFKQYVSPTGATGSSLRLRA
jgi:hypothetical protein